MVCTPRRWGNFLPDGDLAGGLQVTPAWAPADPAGVPRLSRLGVIHVFLRRLFGLVPADPFTEGLQLMQRGELRAAVAAFEPLLQASDEGVLKMARLYACEALLQLGDEILDSDETAALECFESAAGLQPSFADIHHRIGRLRLQAGDVEGARNALEHSLEINPRFFVARVDMVEACLVSGSGDAGAALDALEAYAPPLYAEDVAAVRNFVEADNVEAALARILAIRTKTPDPRDHVKARAVAALQDQQPERAVELLESVMGGGRRFPDLLQLLGLAYGALERHEDAEKVFRDALVIHPGYAKARMNLALTLMELERWAEAEAELHTVLEDDPAHPLALGALQEIRAQVGDE